MTDTADSVLRASFAGRGDELRLSIDPSFQGLPDAAHGGSVLAAFDAAAGVPTPHEVRGIYRRRVPLGVPLRLRVGRRDGAVTCRLFDETDAVLVEGHVAPAAAAPTPPPGPPGEPVAAAGRGASLPVSSTCFACGVQNRLGLRVHLSCDDARVWGRWQPPATAAGADGSLAPIALTALLDEAAFWLGALASGEAGMTTDLAVVLTGPVPFGEPIEVTGARGATRVRAEDPRYWDTEITARDAAGRVVATARITFVAVRGAARRLVSGLLALNPPDVLRRVFPAYTP